MFICKQVITKEECKQICSELHKWQKGATNAGPSHKDNSELSHHKWTDYVYKQMIKAPEMTLKSFIKKMTKPRFNKYEVGQKYAKHVDFFRQEGMQTDWSYTLFLTDDYEGGELIIDDKEFKLPAGDMIVYPSGQLHEVVPITKGTRIAAIGWAESFISDGHERDILTKLAEELNKEDNVNLSYVYNNLLRKWSK